MSKTSQDRLEVIHRYRRSPEGRETRRRYDNKPSIKAKKKKYDREYRRKNAAILRSKDQRKHHQQNHGEPFEEKIRRLERQEGRCANPGCQTTDPGTKGWCTDHDHKTEKIRGELCGGCNKALGLLYDDPIRCEGLAQYLRQPK